MTAINIEHLNCWVGKTQVKKDNLNPFSAQALAAALDHSYSPSQGAALPAFWDWLYFLDTPKSSLTDLDGHPNKGGFLPPVPLPRRMWAAGEVETIKPLTLGVEAKRKSTIEEINIKEGSTGLLAFVTVGHETFQQQELCIRQTQSIVYRQQPPPGSPLPAAKSPNHNAEFSLDFSANQVLLFRYSALTYNAHRIHYDRNYAMEEEGYPALVVHGPLLVTLLLNAAAQYYPKVKIKRFNFKALRPTFDIHPFKLQGCLQNRVLHLWTIDKDNALCMQITAELDHEC
ncbi:acyl-CoA dehydrogenase [Dasania sp. GY-MA-18]|uniref:Acyl-CoA dehydrogenase n=1 Tax=Dasania phycosphaerae TaxID=2950436 RepID=A0A9J6RNQ7_9GAMM|nr:MULTISPECIES: acyl-CoA dehydrogenase [Dasania]MCR8923519.1 acyl-CoA dehydrogenase [Dasania sp. GY-MA-18]MCZ0865953.1 acyl-CoA dehydrogenase [Dasania phycosphaerae]MCZ0869677.1 acyl-CoA dehydrogenase [Dasania phycosphaerae]